MSCGFHSGVELVAMPGGRVWVRFHPVWPSTVARAPERTSGHGNGIARMRAPWGWGPTSCHPHGARSNARQFPYTEIGNASMSESSGAPGESKPGALSLNCTRRDLNANGSQRTKAGTPRQAGAAATTNWRPFTTFWHRLTRNSFKLKLSAVGPPEHSL
jgi:hypothetical protein